MIGVLSGASLLALGDLLLALGSLEKRLVEEVVGLDHVIDDRRLGDLLGAELSGSAEVVTVIVAQVVVRSDRERLDTSVDEELGEDRLDLGLSGLEIVSGDERFVVLGKVDAAGNKGVLGSSVDEGRSLEDGSDGKDGRRRNFGVRILDGLEQVLLGVVDAGDDLGVALSVGSPENNDLVQPVGGLEVADVLANLLEVSRLVLAGQDVVRALSLAVRAGW